MPYHITKKHYYTGSDFMITSVSVLQDKDPIDAHYERLNTEISVLEKDTKEYKAGVANHHS